MTDKVLRIDIANQVIESALILLKYGGIDERIDGISGPVKVLEIKGISLLHSTPASQIFTAVAPYGLDIWFGVDGKSSKVFSAWWTLIPDLRTRAIDLVRLNRGPWIPLIHELAQLLGNRPPTFRDRMH